MPQLNRENQGYFDRLQRAESWMARAEAVGAVGDWEDYHGVFIFYWIAFSALYGRGRTYPQSDEAGIRWFLDRICVLDRENVIRKALEPLKRKADVLLLKDKFLVKKYWDEGTTPKVRAILQEDYDHAQQAWEQKKVDRYLEILFTRRLLVLRNQIFHGCSTDRRSLNKTSLMPAVAIVEELIPKFVEILRLHGEGKDWDGIPYPRDGSPLNPDS